MLKETVHAGDFEGRFLKQLSDRGFIMKTVPTAEYHPEYQDAAEGMYHIIAASKLS